MIDVIWIVCANAESDLAALLAPHLTKPREAKNVVANLLAAPGKIAVTRDAIHAASRPPPTSPSGEPSGSSWA